MKPIDFAQSTKVLQRPSTMAESECQSLPVWNDSKQCVSCWKATFKERLNILLTGKVWLGVLSGKTQPPVFVSGESVFVKEPLKARFLAFLAEVKESIIEAWESTKEAAKQPDKRKHFFVGVLISLVIGTLLGWLVGRIHRRKSCRNRQGMVGFQRTRHSRSYGCRFHNDWCSLRNPLFPIVSLLNLVMIWQR